MVLWATSCSSRRLSVPAGRAVGPACQLRATALARRRRRGGRCTGLARRGRRRPGRAPGRAGHDRRPAAEVATLVSVAADQSGLQPLEVLPEQTLHLVVLGLELV